VGELRSVHRISVWLLLITGLTAASGYARELSVAIAFGAGKSSDAYFIASSVPMVLGDLLLGAALIASVVPTFSGLIGTAETPGHEARSVFTACLLTVVSVGAMLAALLLISMPGIIALLGPGLSAQSRQLAIWYGQWFVWLLPVNGLITLMSLALNAKRIFLLPATTWLVINLAFVVAVILGHSSAKENVFIWAALCGPALMVVLLTWRVSKAGLLGFTPPAFSSEPFRKGIALARPMIITLGIGSTLGLLMISHIVLRRYGSTLEEGAVSALSYAFRVYEVPISLVAATAGTLALPAFSRLFHAKENAKIPELAKEMTSWGILLLLPAMAFTLMEAEFLIELLFHGGNFSDKAAALTASALRGFAPSIVFETFFIVCFRIAYAIQRPGIAVTTGATSIVCLWLFLQIAVKMQALVWLAASLSASFGVAALLSLTLVSRSLRCRIAPTKREIMVAAGAAITAAAALAVWQSVFSQNGLASFLVRFCVFASGYLLPVCFLLPDRRSQIQSLLGVSTRLKRTRDG
jgi:putative peptidoglycan lipid II flippase